MGQVTIYLEPEVEKKMREAAEKNGLSQSKWVANLIKEKTATTWPASIVNMAGSWKDIPTAEEIREGTGEDSPREPF